jgi:methylthioribose-1-phosphate isomerase
VYERYNSVQAVADAIKTMVVRGAPAIGVTAAYGVALAAIECKGIVQDIIAACDVLGATRPTAVNLFWSIDRMKKVVIASNGEFETILKEAHSIFEEDIAACKKIGTIGAAHFKDGYTVLTHCNAGALATAGWGTALGVIRSAVEAGKSIKVIADETRPRLQGANLTSWELSKEGIDVTVISDNAAASLMRLKKIDAVVVGADRIAANGDTCNKIGTYSVALAANAAGIPFYVAAPLSTVDINCATGDDIPIEYRDDEEVTHIHGVRILPEGVKVLNPAFDVTPGKYITAIFTEAGEISGNYIEGFKNLFRK